MGHWTSKDGHLFQVLLGISSLSSGSQRDGELGAQCNIGWHGPQLAGSSHKGNLASMEVMRGCGPGEPPEGIERDVVSCRWWLNP